MGKCCTISCSRSFWTCW